MLTLRTLHSLRTHRNVKGFRISRTSTGLSLSHVEQRRLYLESIALMNRQIQRAWLADGWQRHACRLSRWVN